MGAGCVSPEETNGWKGYEHQLFSDKKPQSVELKDFLGKGMTAIRRHPAAKDGFLMYSKDADGNDIDSGWKTTNIAFKKYQDLPLFGYRPFVKPDEVHTIRGDYKWDSYKTIQQQVYALSNGIRTLDFPAQSNVGIFSSNRSEWMITHFSNWNNSYPTVALYDTLGAQAVQYIVWHAELIAIFVEKDKLPQLFEAIKSCGKDRELKLKYVIQYDYQQKYNNKHESISEDDKNIAKEYGLQLISFNELITNNSDKSELTDLAPKPDDVAYIMYTSGTTGNPKGVVLTHKGFACTVSTVFRGLGRFGDPMNSTDAHVSYLPLAHIFESTVMICLISSGARIAFYGGNIKTIAEDWKAIRPTIMMGVPRIYNKTYDKIILKAGSAGGVKSWLFHKALKASSKAIRSGKRVDIYDKIIWKKVAEQAGFDRVRLMASGAAPLPPHIAEFLRILCPNSAVLQGYGLTETCAASFFTQADDLNLGHVGIPADHTEFRLIDAPECEYYVTDEPCSRGEVQIRGPSVMNGYYKNEEVTKKVLSSDGWFSTGDIGRINPNGTLSIIDRRKNMFKTAMGEYVASEKCEMVYGKSNAVNQIFIYGNSFKSFVVAIIVPDPLWLVPILIEKGKWNDQQLTPATPKYCEKFKNIVADNYDLVKTLIKERISELEKNSDLKKFEKIKDFVVEYDVDELLQGFNVKNNTLTPTFKKKRPQLLKRYKESIQKLYNDNGEPVNDDEHW